MPTLTETHTFSIDTESYVTRSAVTSDGIATKAPTVPAALAGTLADRTTDTSGVVTLAAGHGLEAGRLVDVYHEGGRLPNALIDSVDGDAVTFAGDAGDVLPAVDSPVAVAVPVVAAVNFAGDDALGFGVKSPAVGFVAFLEAAQADATAAHEVEIKKPGDGKGWTSAGDVPNPLAGKSIAGVRFSHADPNRAAVMSVTVLVG